MSSVVVGDGFGEKNILFILTHLVEVQFIFH